MTQGIDRLPLQLSADQERRLDEFDAAWNAGPPPNWERFLPPDLRTADHPPRPQWRRYVAELLTVDLEYRLRCSGPETQPRIENYYERIPWLPHDDVLLLEMIPAEYMARQRYADGADVAEYVQRFPQLGAAVEARLHEARSELKREEPGGEQLTDSFSAVTGAAPADATFADTVVAGASFAGDTASVPPNGMAGTFGDYELQYEVARGGMGIVYKAVQKSLKRTVALKVILAGGFARPSDVRRFHSEAEAAARLDHPNIVPIYDVGQVDGHHFFSMAYVDGPSLSAEISRQPLDPQRAALIVRDVADAMHSAHLHEVVHRDLKPSNILLEGGRTPRVTDFGLARQTNVESGLTVTGQVLGTPSYMPPEQALGHVESIDGRSDVYSLGATLYCMLTGRAPFQAASVVQTLAQVVQQEPVAPRRLNGDVPRDLENICLKCLQKSAAARYQTAAELRDDLDRFLSGTPTIARPLSSSQRLLRYCRRHPGTATLIGCVLLLLVLLSAVSMLRLREKSIALETSEAQRIVISVREREAREAQQDSDRARGVAEEARQEMESALRLAEFNIYVNALQRIGQLWEEGQVDTARRLHADLKNLRLWEQLRGWEWEHLDRQLRQERLLVHAHQQSVLDACWSPDGSRFATAGQDRMIKLWDSDSGRHHRTLIGHSDWVRGIRFVGDGSRLLSLSSDGTARLWETEKGGLLRIVSDELDGLGVAAISPDGSRWAWSDRSGRITVRDLDTDRPLAEWDTPQAQITAIRFDSSGDRIAAAADDQTIVLRRLGGEDPIVTLANADATTFALAFSFDGERLAAAGGSGRVQVWDSRTGERIGRWNAHRGSIYDIQFGSDADQLATCSEDQTLRLWSISRESALDVFRGHVGAVFRLQFKPDTQELLSAGQDGTLRLWRPGRDQLHLDALAGNEDVFASADGAHLFCLNGPVLRKFGFDSPAAPVEITLPLSNPKCCIPFPDPPEAFALGGETQVLVCDGGGRLLVRLPEARTPVRLLSVDAQGAFLAVADEDGRVRIDDVATATTLWDRMFPTRVTAMTFSADGGRFIAADIEGEMAVLETRSGAPLERANLLHGPQSMDVCATVPRLAVGGIDGTIHLCDPVDLSQKSTLRGHQGGVLAVAFSPDGRRLASAGSDRKIRIWAPEVRDWAPDQEALLLTLQGHDRPIRRLFWTDDGRSLISLDYGGTAIRWRTDERR